MKVLSLSLDPHVLRPDSVVVARSRRYGEALERYAIVVPVPNATTLVVSNTVTVYGSGGRSKAVQFWRLYRRARQLIVTEQYDVISSQDTYFLGMVAIWLARRHHIGVEVQVLGIEKLSWWRKRLSQFVLRRAGSIRVLSLGLKNRLLTEFNITEDRMRLVPIYVDVSSLGLKIDEQTPAVQAQLREHQASFQHRYGSRFNVVSVNRLVPIKNIPMQLAAVAALKDRFPKLLLHVVGDGPLQAALQVEIDRLDLHDHVILHGYKAGAELSPFFTESDCFVLTSDFEGYGMVVVEAATAGLPIVMTEVGCAGEVVIDGQSALIVPPRDTVAFTAALEQVITKPALRAALSAGAHQAVADLPSFDTLLQRYLASWQQAFNNRV